MIRFGQGRESGDDTTPDETIVAGLVRQGYTSGKGWLLDSDGDLTEDDFDHIASLIEEGYTSGRGPNWTVDLPEAAQRVARVWPADGMVNVRVDRGESEEVDVSMTAEEIGEEKDLADLLATETALAP